jgi:proton-dependent oligopeptide transporter, POT family
MNSATAEALRSEEAERATTFGGHPRGLRTLFFTEMWERFSYYGMRALLVLYLTAAVAQGGLSFPVERATSIYGWYTGLVYLSALPGGWLADRFLGQRRSVLIGGCIIAAGHFSLAVPTVAFLYLGLALIIVGVGFLKPNISTMVGGLYRENDARRDAGFSIFYMGINIGAMIAPLVCGFLAQSTVFLGFLERRGIDPRLGWHFGFAMAGFGMLFGVAQFAAGRRQFGANADGPRERPAAQQAEERAPLSREDWMRMGAIAVLFVFSCVFWSSFEQAGSSLNLFADRLVDNRFFGHAFPSSWYQAVNSTFIILLAPVFAWLWVRLGPREPSSPAKFAWGLFWVGAGFVVVAAAAQVAQASGHRVSPWWMVVLYLFHTIGELCLSPVGLSTVTKLAPVRFAAFMMGVWFTSLAVGNRIGGWVAGHFDPNGSLPRLFLAVAAFAIGAAVLLALLTRPIKKLMAGVH